MLDVEAIGDAAALLSQRSTYRELPLEWVCRIPNRTGYLDAARDRIQVARPAQVLRMVAVSVSCLIRQVLRQVERGGGFRVIGTRTFPMTFNAPSLQSQLKFAREEASHITDPALRAALDAAAKRLHARTVDLGGDRVVTPPNARNYAIVLERLRDPS